MLCFPEVQGRKRTLKYGFYGNRSAQLSTFQMRWYYQGAARQHLDNNLNIIGVFRLPQVGNIKKETVALWYKDGREVKGDGNLTFTEGVLNLEIAQVRGILMFHVPHT